LKELLQLWKLLHTQKSDPFDFDIPEGIVAWDAVIG